MLPQAPGTPPSRMQVATTKPLRPPNNTSTPKNVNKLRECLLTYLHTLAAQELIQGFSAGFKLCYEGPRIARTCYNLKSLNGREHKAMKLIKKKVSLGWVACAFLAHWLGVKKMVHLV